MLSPSIALKQREDRIGAVQKLKHQGLKIELQPCTNNLYAYGGRELEVEGLYQSDVSVTKTKIVVDFIVVKTGRCFLGYSTATQGTATLLMVLLWENSKQNTPMCSMELANQRVISRIYTLILV